MFNRGYDERGVIFPLLGEAGAEDRVQVLTEAVGKGVEVNASLHVVERNAASVVIQEDPNFAGLGRQRQSQAGARQSLHLPALQPQAPEAAVRAQLDLTLALSRAVGHAERPGRLARHVHLPVVSPGADALPAQDEEGRAEAPRSLRIGGLALFKPHLLTVIGHGQVPLGCGRVQNHLSWTRKSRLRDGENYLLHYLLPFVLLKTSYGLPEHESVEVVPSCGHLEETTIVQSPPAFL